MNKCLFVLLMILLLSGCSTYQTLQPTAQPKVAWQHNQQHLSQLHSWQIQGLVGIVTPDQALSADAAWSQQQGDYHINFSGALGLGTVTLRSSAGKVTLVDPHGKQQQAASAKQLMQRKLGWYVPVRGLIYWVRGLPRPKQPRQEQLNNKGVLAHLQQDGWHITYSRYGYVKGYPLPHRLVLKRPDLTVTMVINSWHLS